MQKTIYVYCSHIDEFGGVSTFLYNWCLQLRNYYDITILYGYSNENQLKRLSKLVKVEKWFKDKTYTCDIVLRNSVWGEVPYNLISKDNRYLEMRHANYKYLADKNKLHIQYHKWDKVNEIIGCGEFVSKMSHEVLGDNPTTIINILAPKVKTKKIIHLISCTRLDQEKGWGRMLQLMEMLKKADIKFRWDIFTPDKRNCDYEEVYFHKPRYDIWNYLANADYTVLLSDSEGLSYTVQESLQYQVPVICTDVGGNRDLIKDGINGYLVPLDMNFDIKKILNIPKLEEYNNHALEKWLDYLGNSKYEEKEIIEMNTHKVIALKEFTYNEYDLVEFIEKKVVRKPYIFKGDIFKCSKEQYEYLSGNNSANAVVVELISIDEPKEVKKVTTKKTTKKKK